MAKIKVINTCFECNEHFGWNKLTSKDRCKLSQKDIDNPKKIPLWCKLEDYTQKEMIWTLTGKKH